MGGSTIALDVMGGDGAPAASLKGALRVCAGEGTDRVDPGRLLLVGDEPTIRGGLEERGGNPGFALLHASQVIAMGDSPAQALRAKPDSSIMRCVGAVKTGQAGAVVSMGNTGAVVGAATVGLGTLAGVRRPGIAVTLELTGDPVTLIDMGANISPKPDHLFQYGAMGSVYMQSCLGVKRPRIGLLNVGEEKGKGTDVQKEAYGLFEDSPFEFVGNVEGSDIFQGRCDVVVCDGFTGNVVLKLLEQFSTFFLGRILGELERHGAAWGQDALKNLRRSIDYSTYGGALLLGVNGVVVIGHGRSDENAVANAVALACRAIDARVNDKIEAGLAEAPRPPATTS